jgi:hypothetical protein
VVHAKGSGSIASSVSLLLNDLNIMSDGISAKDKVKDKTLF